MKRFTDFFKSKGFYIALGTGALAFVGLLALYNYNSTKKEMLGEQAIDLNQPAELDDVSEADVAELDTNDEVKPDDKNVAEAGSDSAVADTDKTEETAGDTDAESIADVGASEEAADDTDVPVISNAAGAAFVPLPPYLSVLNDFTFFSPKQYFSSAWCVRILLVSTSRQSRRCSDCSSFFARSGRPSFANNSSAGMKCFF